MLIRTEGDGCELMLCMHHIISDAWSLEVLEREVRAILTAFAQDQPSPLKPLPVQYADFALWQRDHLTGGILNEQLQFWTRALTGAPPVIDLPIARPRPPVPTYRGAAQSRTIPTGVAQALRTLGRREGATLFMTTLAAFNVLLGRYTGLDDLVVGTPVAGRDRAETEPLIGFFVNTLVIRTDLSGDPTIAALIRRTRDVCLGAFAHQDLPFEMLVEALHPDRDLSRNPLFQITFQCSSEAGGDAGSDAERPDAEAMEETLDVQHGTAKFDLAINVWDDGAVLRLQADYSTDLFEDAAVSRLLRHFEHVLGVVAESPDATVSSVPLVAEEAQRLLLSEWNQTAASYPRDASLGALFDRQVAARPAAIAVIHDEQSLTYADLSARADALARQHRAEGVGPETMVGLFAGRSIEMIVGVLGMVRAGGA
jgi:non-ribosomal peptide synthetase component F